MDFQGIYDEYHGKIRKYIAAYVKDDAAADDLVQETFTRVMEKGESVSDPAKLSSWIFRVALNLCHDHYRGTRKYRCDEDPDSIPGCDAESPDAQKQIERNEMSICVKDKTNLLPKTLRDPLILFDVMEFNHREIAKILEISEKNAKVRLHRARKKMKEILENECTFDKDEQGVMTCEQRKNSRRR